MLLPKQVWKDVKDYEGLYQVSNTGKVRSLNYMKTGRVQVLKLMVDKDDYKKVHLHKKGKSRTYQVHRLVAEAFLENPNNLPCVNHKDENKQNNNVSNLEFCSYEYNNNYGTKLERGAKTKKANKNRAKKILVVEEKRIFNTLSKVAEYLDCSSNYVWTCIRKGCKCKGYTLKYIESEVI